MYVRIEPLLPSVILSIKQFPFHIEIEECMDLPNPFENIFEHSPTANIDMCFLYTETNAKSKYY